MLQTQQGDSFAGSANGRNGQQLPLAPVQPMPLLDNSHLRPGASAALLSHEKKFELYRLNAKKTNDPELIFEFAVFCIEAAKSLEASASSGAAQGNTANEQKRDDLIREAVSMLKTLSSRGHPDAQYFLADCYANGIGTARGKQDFEKAFPLFVLSAKHGHPDAAYRAGTCCEHGWGCRRESAKAVQFYRKAAAALHPGAMYRLGTAELNGALGLPTRPKEGVKWLKRSAENATPEFPHALHELALLHERGIDNVLFVDLEYASELLAQAAELGYAPSAFKLGECYEYGRMGCPQDAALSIHYYNIAAQQDHRDGCFALTAWYLVGSPGVLPQSDTEAFLWAKKAAELGLAKAQYAIGYFTEVGIGTPISPENAIKWYKLASENGDKRAANRLTNFSKAGMNTNINAAATREELLARATEGDSEGGKKEKDCVIM
ncbi:Chitin synthase regulator 2 [Naganishia vaughanmartiniae]|uniref:Chitin synthase regulator 2 n=1 Tax=Naganishia vaughanmartiniae TaxID=1424756 RepID=A0ACC2X963_9TREE|nr:Chitin synthase regulator 2 [Naganishia vaughanmartiniae]